MSKIWKVVLIILASVVSAMGIVFLGIYLSGGFTAQNKYPKDIFFANVEIVDSKYTNRTTPYYDIDNLELILSTTTEDFNQWEVALSFPTTQSGNVVRYLKQVNLDEVIVSDNIFLYFGHDSEGNIMKFASCGQTQATYITNGIIIIPIKVSINQKFNALVCVAPDNINEEIIISENGESIENNLYNIGGYSQVIATSANLNIPKAYANIYIDVPIESIDLIGITGENISQKNVLGLNEYLLTETDENGYCEVGVDSLFSVILDIAPARAVYRYGKNGNVGAADFKKIVFNIHSDSLVVFIDNNEEIIDTTRKLSEKYVTNLGINLTDLFGNDFNTEDYTISFGDWSDYKNIINYVEEKNGIIFVNIKNTQVNENFEIPIIATPKDDKLDILTKFIYGNDNSLKYGFGVKTTTVGNRFLSLGTIGQAEIFVHVFKNALLEDQILGNISSIDNIYDKMDMNPSLVLSSNLIIDISEINISGFEVTDKYNQGSGSELDLTINYETIVFANNSDSDYSLGIDIISNISAQKQIKNILLSIQFSLDGINWYDATQANELIIDLKTIQLDPLFVFDLSNVILTGNDLKISDTNPLYYYNFYRVQGSANMSYWQIFATNVAEILVAENAKIRIFTYYLSPNNGLILDEEGYGPYYIDSIVNPVKEIDIEWTSTDELKNSNEVGAGNYNERILINDKDKISLTSIAQIMNLEENPTYKTIKYFIYSELDNLEDMLNVKRYYGEIPGVSSGIIYEINASDNELICLGFSNSEITFRLIFAIVENDYLGNPVKYSLGDKDVYRIVATPLHGDYIIFAPIKIQKTLNTDDVEVGISDLSEFIKPYQIGDEGANNTYFLQGTEKNIKYSITLNSNDLDLFKTLIRNGDICLNAKYITGEEKTACNDICLQYKINGNPKIVALSNVLTTIFASETTELNFYDYGVFVPIDNLDETFTYIITLSTREIDFDDADEKEVRIDLEYILHGDNIPATYQNPIIMSTSQFYIYSGKILEAYFGEKGNQITNGYDNCIYIEKFVSGENFTTSIYSYKNDAAKIAKDKTDLSSLFTDNKVNVYINEFKIDSGYTISSDNLSVAQVVYFDGGYIINFLQSGTVTLTLTPDYAHSEFLEKTLTFITESNYKLVEIYGNDMTDPPSDDRILGYQSSPSRYQIVGQQENGTEIKFSDLIDILAVTSGTESSVLDEFEFNINYLFKDINGDDKNDLIWTPDNPTGKIEIIYNESTGELTGFIIKNNFGNNATIIATATSASLGATFVYNINIIPYEQIVGDIIEHENATKPGDAEINSSAVFAETIIDVSNFGYQHYDKGYKNIEIPGLSYNLYNENGELAPDKATFNYQGLTLIGIKFNAVDNITKYTLRIILEDNNNYYNTIKEYVFYVSPNIQVDENSFKNGENVKNGQIYLNNEANPILNGQIINIESSSNVVNIIYGIKENKIDFTRILGSNSFDPSLFTLIEICEHEKINKGISYTASGAQKLIEKTLILSYSGKEFIINYYAAPNIQMTENAKTVTFDGEEYVVLYAGQPKDSLNDWFVRGESNTEIVLGTLIKSGIVKNLPLLYVLDKTTAFTFDQTTYNILKNEEYGLIKTSIAVYYGSGDEQEYRVFDVLIFPFEWQYLNYTNPLAIDLKDILDGKDKEKIISGANYIINGTDKFLNVKDFETLVASQTSTRITYKLFEINDGIRTQKFNMQSDPVRLAIINDKLTLATQPLGQDKIYEIEFSYNTTIGTNSATYIFSYYLKITTTQTIEVNYPYGSSGSSEINDSINLDEDNYQRIYYSQFKNGQYILDLNSTTRNFSEKYFVELYVEENLIKQNDSPPSYNKLEYSIEKIYNYDTAQSINETDYSNLVNINNGLITIKQTNAQIGYIIKATTSNGAVGYYKIVTELNETAQVQVATSKSINLYNGEGKAPIPVQAGIEINRNNIILVDEDPITISDDNISKSFDLSKLTLGGTTYSNDVEFRLINSYGNVHKTGDMMFIYNNGTEESPNYYVVTRTAANDQDAILVVYTEKDGIIAEIPMKTLGAYNVDYDQPYDYYGDTNSIDLLSGLTIIGPSGEISLSALENVDYLIEFEDSKYIIYNEENSGASFGINPLSNNLSLKLTLYIWGEDLGLDGETKATKIRKDITLNIQANIATINATDETLANNKTSGFSFNISAESNKMFDQLGGGVTDYHYDVEIFSWDGGMDEIISLEAITNGNPSVLNLTDNSLSSFLNENVTLYMGPVVTTRTAEIRVTVYKGTSYAEKIGDAFVATYTLIITPDTTIAVSYPDYGTGINFNSEFIYWKDYEYVESQSLLGTLIFTPTVMAGHTVTYKSLNEDLITIDEYTGKITKVEEVQSNTDVIIQIKIDGLVRASYIITITNEPVWSAKFDDGTNTKTEQIADVDDPSGKNLFELDEGNILVNTKGATADRSFILEILATPKYSNRGIASVDSQYIYGVGGASAQAAELFKIGKNKINPTPTFSEISINDTKIIYKDDPNIDDTDIWTVSENSIEYKREGTYIVKIVKNESGSPVTNYYLVVVSEALNETYNETYYKSTNLTLNDIFGTEINNYDFYTYSYNVGVYGSVILEVDLTPPTALLTYYYMGYQIPYETAKEKYFADETDTTITDTMIGDYTVGTNFIYNKENSVSIYNKFGKEVAIYKYTIVYDYKIPKENINEIIKSENAFIGKNADEFKVSSYPNDRYNVLNLVTITAGSSYDLIDILIRQLSMKAFNGITGFNKSDFKNDMALSYGYYNSNAQYTSNISAMIGIAQVSITGNAKLHSYTITPYGAQNGGDIVHLILKIGRAGEEDIYVLRIKIMPNISIQSVSGIGEISTRYSGTDDMLYALSNFVTLSKITPDKLTMVVLDDSDAQYVSSGNKGNRLENIGTSVNPVYGIKLKKTVLGGAKIRFRISDPYGYIATDANGHSIIFTLYYQNSSGEPPQIASQVANIYEGDELKIVYRYESGDETLFKTYDAVSKTWSAVETEPTGNVIMLENINISIDNLDQLSINITTKINTLNGLFNYNSGVINSLTTNYLPNTRYGNATGISGETLLLTISYNNDGFTETCRKDINTTINQRYQLRFKSPYASPEIYLKKGITYNLSGANGLFYIYDLKKLDVAENEISFTATNIGDQLEKENGILLQTYLKLTSQNLDWESVEYPNFVDKLINGGSQKLIFTLSGSDWETSLNEFTINYNITPTYYNMNDNKEKTYLDYGIIINRGSNNTAIPLSEWGVGYKLYDYYETGTVTNLSPQPSPSSITFRKLSGAAGTTVDETSGEISKLSPGESIIIAILSDGAQIGTAKVTLSRYYDIEGFVPIVTPYSRDEVTVLPFNHSTTDLFGWGEGILAKVVGELQATEQISGSQENFFEYAIDFNASTFDEDYLAPSLEYNSLLNCYVVNNFSNATGIAIQVKYMGKEIGKIMLLNKNDSWQASSHLLSTDEFSYTKNEDNKTITICSVIINDKQQYSIAPYYVIGETVYTVTTIGNGTTAIAGASLEIIILPNTVTKISDVAFINCSNLTSINIPNSVTTIGGNAFQGCTSLASINIPDSVTTIGEYAFYNCSSLTSINIPNSITTIGGYAFQGCTSLASINIPDSVTVIADSAFYNCSSLTSINIPSSVTTIGGNAFYNCSSLTSVTIPNSVTTIGYAAFRYCESLTSINIPDSVTVIADSAFGNCSNLTSINIPNSVNRIEKNAFSGCYSLTKIYIPSSVITILAENYTNSPFYYCSIEKIYCQAAFKPAGWGAYWNNYSSSGTLTTYWSCFSVTYDENDEIYTGTEPQDLTFKMYLPETLPVLTQSGYTFLGWYYDSEFTNQANAGDYLLNYALNSNTITLYAKWEED